MLEQMESSFGSYQLPGMLTEEKYSFFLQMMIQMDWNYPALMVNFLRGMMALLQETIDL